MTFGFSNGSRRFRKLLCVSYDVWFYTDKIESIGWLNLVPRLRIGDCFEIHILSLRTLWSAVIKSPESSARSAAPPVRFLQGDLVILVLLRTSLFRSLGKWVKILCFPKPLFLEVPNLIHEKCLRVCPVMLTLLRPLDFLWSPGKSRNRFPCAGSMSLLSAYGLRALRLTKPRAHPGATTFPPVGAFSKLASATFWRPTHFPWRLFAVPTITGGHARSWQCEDRHTQPLRKPDCTLSRLHSREYDRPVTQSWATPEPRCPGPHLRSSVNSLRPWVCHHTREPTVLSRVSCRPAPEFWPFSPALPVTLAPLLTAADNSRLLDRDWWGLSSLYHVATTYLCKQPGLSSSSSATNWRYFATPTWW